MLLSSNYIKMKSHWIKLFICMIFINYTFAQNTDRICATSRFDAQCAQLQRSNSEVICQKVQDSIECAQRLQNGTADFGIFSAETTLLLASMTTDGVTIIKELRHKERNQSPVDYESVVLVRATHTGGLEGLRDYNLCHPGYHYDKTTRWSEHFLKYFERSVVEINCQDGNTPAEIETVALTKFFKTACRPGTWSNNVQEDIELKQKFPELCALCNPDPNDCNYIFANAAGEETTDHENALRCLAGDGDNVAYVTLDSAQAFLQDPTNAEMFAYLCPNGTVQNSTRPCVWIRQPWNVIISRNERSIDLSSRIVRWMASGITGNWESAIKEIISADNVIVRDVQSIQAPRDYFVPMRNIPITNDLCSTAVNWCTTSHDEYDKCALVREAGITVGTLPLINCYGPMSNTVACLNEISNDRADFMGIDSNFGYLARFPHNLTTVMYAETEQEKYSTVVIVVKASAQMTTFEDLKNTRACFPEFGGIASIAFVNVAKARGVFPQNDCNIGRLLGEYFGDSCAPGSRDSIRDYQTTNPQSLCNLCRVNITPAKVLETDEEATTETEGTPVEGSDDVDIRIDNAINCVPDQSNRYYGNKGALLCLQEAGDVAIVELQYLKDHANALGYDPAFFRIMCRNGSLAEYTGFDVDNECALTTIIDGEVVIKRNSLKAQSVVAALSSFDKYFQNDPDIKMFNIFKGVKDLLFKDSTIGLVSPNEPNLGTSVQNYIRLFESVEKCTDGNHSNIIKSNILILIFSFLFIYYVYVNRIN